MADNRKQAPSGKSQVQPQQTPRSSGRDKGQGRQQHQATRPDHQHRAEREQARPDRPR